MINRFYPHQWGEGQYKWSVMETPAGGMPEPLSVITWLTEQQAIHIAEYLNDTAGYEWSERHPDWL